MSNTNGEQLRECCSLGDVTKVQILINSGVNVNSQNPVNGWTALHWAAKRNHCDVIKLLLENGANKEMLNKDGKSPRELTTNPDVLALLGHNVIIKESVQQESKTTFVPNYLANPPFIYSQQQHQQPNKQQHQQPNKQQELPEAPPPPAQSHKGTGFWYQPREMFAVLKDSHKPCGLVVHPEYLVLRALGWANNVELQFKR
uniref:Ankyrin repeat domain-containing protein 40-like n=1 Tax=Ciona intestinalis TaxID=7719 RepID=H2XRN9_CIOIN|nr:ankyrin repeat domain-containing protein 40-like [Ciona intestinalis]|eukprot:XP_026691734.1 ankyrin repeat domain-containing protein 40-like [Ciona intestinalis]